ncbi:hypothetical protein QM306_38395, partial [Burkholderia cenocepacia]|nr:hypothetical protein [Burkholderia cenocepacia]
MVPFGIDEALTLASCVLDTIARGGQCRVARQQAALARNRMAGGKQRVQYFIERHAAAPAVDRP